ncbi:MAG: hypothetical protein Q9168_008085 [Polycauliona sp. 1 TL-2023]
MADPLSFVASTIAVATLASHIVTKGYTYVKAVKDCREDVRKLMVEVNVLCGILQRLVVLLEGSRSKTATTVQNDKHRPDSEADSDQNTSDEEKQDDESIPLLEPPQFVSECRKTLLEIEAILNQFAHKTTQPAQLTNQGSRFSLSRLRQLPPKELKWPLTKSKTLQLIGALERHKTTCTIALGGEGLAGVHAILEQTTLTNKHLVELRAKQETLLEMQLNQKEEAALAWLSKVDSTSKLQDFRRERQGGTGTWLFDLSEFSDWLDTPNTALWIYGIPGAGKTILSTLVIDEVLTRLRSETIGSAYFYVRHNDTDSHQMTNVLGSLIAQLARQNRSALAQVMEQYEQHTSRSSVTAPPDDDDLIDLLNSMFTCFTETYIMIDGLDECGPPLAPSRKRLVDATSVLRNETAHVLIFSRDEADIRQQLVAESFRTVSIAATSADLRLFVSAWIPLLDIRSERLKAEVVDTLVNEANGMFMWVRAQIDYLQRLPNDAERRKALKKLPPDLTQTYNRIFEVIEATYPEQTTKLIKRVLMWLRGSLGFRVYNLTVIRQAICIEDEHEWPEVEVIPSREQMVRWLGCLIRYTSSVDNIELSHFSVYEYLAIDPAKLDNLVARRYLVDPDDYSYEAAQLQEILDQQIHLGNQDRNLKWRVLAPLHLATVDLVPEEILMIHPAVGFPELDTRNKTVLAFIGHDSQTDLRSLQTVPMLVDSGADVNQQQLLVTFDFNDLNSSLSYARCTPLILAVLSRQWEIARFLLDRGANWDAVPNSDEVGVKNLCSISSISEMFPSWSSTVKWEERLIEVIADGDLLKFLTERQDSKKHKGEDSSLDPENMLLDACQRGYWTDVRELFMSKPEIDANCVDQRGGGAIHWAAKSAEPDLLILLLEHGADPNLTDKAFVSALLIASGCGRLEIIKVLLEYHAHIEHRGPAGYTPLLESVDRCHFDAMCLLLDAGADCEARADDGSSALHLAIQAGSTEIFTTLLARGVDTSMQDNFGTTPLHLACQKGLHFEVEQILKAKNALGDDLSIISVTDGTPLCSAVLFGHIRIVHLLLDAGANIDQTGLSNSLGSALMDACAQGNVELVKLLLTRGAALEVEGARFGSAAGTARAFRKEAVLKILEEHACASEPRIEELAIEDAGEE